MRNFDPRGAAVLGALALFAGAGAARAQPPAQGFALDRFYPAPAGAGWFVMDDLDMHGGLGGAVELTAGTAHDPLVVPGPGGGRLAVVSDEAVTDVGAAVTYGRWRFYLDLPMPLLLAGSSGTAAGYAFTAPAVSLGTNPDSIPDASFGAALRLLGEAGSAFRLGLGAQLFVPSNGPLDTRATYLTDGTVRAMARLLAAGDLGPWRYAGQVGVHVRPLDDAPIPGSPEGSEWLFGAAAGRAFDVHSGWALIAGPEVYGESAMRAFLGAGTTGVEGLLTGRLEGTGEGAQLRFKVGAGGGLDPSFGAPEWRAVAAVELFSGG